MDDYNIRMMPATQGNEVYLSFKMVTRYNGGDNRLWYEYNVHVDEYILISIDANTGCKLNVCSSSTSTSNMCTWYVRTSCTPKLWSVYLYLQCVSSVTK